MSNSMVDLKSHMNERSEKFYCVKRMIDTLLGVRRAGCGQLTAELAFEFLKLKERQLVIKISIKQLKRVNDMIGVF